MVLLVVLSESRWATLSRADCTPPLASVNRSGRCGGRPDVGVEVEIACKIHVNMENRILA